MNYKIYPAITTNPDFSWHYKFEECQRLNIDQVSIFLTFLNLTQRKRFYKVLEKSNIKYVPHVHIRDDFQKWELDLFFQKYKTRYFNFHEHSFDDLFKWPGYEKYIYLEYNKDNFVNKLVNVNKIGGLCIDFAHLWAAKDNNYIEYQRTLKEIKSYKVGCNHLNGYSKHFKTDLHYVRNKKQLEFIKEVPKKFFGKVISLEMNNSIKKQLEYKKYIKKILI